MARKHTTHSLHQLQFDKKLSGYFIAKYFSNPRYVFLLLFLILTIGVSSYLTLPRTLNPEIKIPIVLVSTIIAGANPTDVEQLVTIPLEDSIRGLSSVKKVSSSSRDSASIITIEFDSGTDPEKARSDVQGAIDTVGLPEDANDPNVVKLDFENQPILQLSLTTTLDNASLFTFGNRLKDKLEDLPEIDRAQLSGIEETEIEIIIRPEIAASYGVNPISLSSLIQNSLKTFPAGNVTTKTGSFALSIGPQVTSLQDIRSLRINLSGQQIALSDIAIVSEYPKPDQPQSFFVRPGREIERSITLDIFRVKTANIDASVNAAEKLIDEEVINSGNRFKVVTLINTSNEIDDQFNELVRDFFIVIFLVMMVLFIFLGARQAIVSVLSAPLAFLITFAVMRATGITHNFLSLFSLLLSLGLLVDDTVVVISAMSAYYRIGKFTPLQTSLLVWRDFIVPIFTTTITTIWAFLPLLLSTGIIGEFIKSIPIVVSTALAGSFLVSILITIPLIIILLSFHIPFRIRVALSIFAVFTFTIALVSLVPKNPLLVPFLLLGLFSFLIITNLVRRQLLNRSKEYFKRVITKRAENVLANGVISFEGINRRYRMVTEKILTSSANRRKVIAMVIIFSIFSFLLLPLGFVKSEFFPQADSNLIFASLELPSGTNMIATGNEAKNVLSELAKKHDAKYIVADIGRGFSQEAGVSGATSNNVLFTLALKAEDERIATSQEIAQEIRKKFASYNKGTFNVQELSGGPPAGAQIQIALLGEDINLLEGYADQVKEYLEKETGIVNVEKSIKPGTSKLTFIPDNVALLRHQITIDQIGILLRIYISGLTVEEHSFTDETEEKDITVRLSSKAISAGEIESLVIPTASGNLPLSSLGKIKLTPSPALITREDGKRTISVTAGVTAGVNIQEKNSALEKFAESKLALREGYSWKTGGVNEENEKSVQSILMAMILSFLLIIVTMVVQFGSFRRAIIVMLVIPLSISGVFIIFGLTRTPISFPALIGMLALFGIVVKNSILLVDKIVQNEKRGMHLNQAIIDAGESRLEPIALTSFCTIVGLIPITLSDPLWRGLGGAIIAGLTFSGTIMLFFIPVVYYYFFQPIRKIKKS
ncbi:efflux RND transporter permease subunit [Candidatus Roizmanbacteria bacterium]|nr:efflux RND transporter permease subunit [Candidatus Roizmanbacteria bacterium]